MTINSDSNGEVQFPKIRQWRIESLFIHGIEVFEWSLCVKKSGYLTESAPLDRKASEQVVQLKVGESTECHEAGMLLPPITN